MNYLTTEGIYIMYLRKSRADERLGIENVLQKHEIELQLLAKREIGYSIPEKYIFREIVSAGTIKDRPLIKEILKIMESGHVKGVLVVDPQRLTRGDMLDQGHIINAFKYTDTLIMTPFKIYDLNEPTGNDMKLIKMELDHGADYLEYYKMIQKRGRLASVMSGNFVTSIPPYGYKRINYMDGGKKIHTLEPVPDQAEIIRLIFEKYNSGDSILQITNYLNESRIASHTKDHWNSCVISKILSNPVYDGKVRWNTRQTVSSLEDGEIVSHLMKNPNPLIFEGKHDAIVDHDVFMEVQRKLSNNKKYSYNTTLKNPLSELILCGKCGRTMKQHYTTRGKTRKRYSQDRRIVCPNNKCDIKSSKLEVVIDAVIDSLQSVVNDFELIIPETPKSVDYSEKIQKLKESLERLNVKEETMFELLETKVYTTDIFTMRHADLEKKRQEISSEIDNLSNITQIETRKEKKMRFRNALESLKDPSISAKTKNDLLKNCIEIIHYNVESNKPNAKLILDIHFKF